MPDMKNERVILMVARERADAVRAQELVLVEQVAENAFELRLRKRREQPSPRITDESLRSRSDLRHDFGVALLVQLDELQQPGMFRDVVLPENRGGAQREQPHHGSHFEARCGSVRQAEDV